MLIFTVNLTPVPQKQTQFSFRKGKPHGWNPSSDYISLFQWQIRPYAPREPFDGPLEVHYSFYLPIPKSTSKCRKRQMLSGLICHMTKPDTSNLAYLVENAMKGIIYKDDAQIRKFTAEKLYSDDPRTVIKIIQVNSLLFPDLTS